MRLDINGIHKSYGETVALNGLNLSLESGIYALLGPNGAGKSTFMNILVDNLQADAGEVLYNGENVKKMGADYRKRIGYMPQQQQLYTNFTAERFLYYVATLKGMKKQEAQKQIGELLEVVNLEACRHKKLGAFSGGMKQRILIAQALLGNPEILIMDEPTAGLDPKERIRIRNIISKTSFNRIVIIATHVVSDIEFIAKEILFLQKGELIERGNLFELKEKMQGRVYELVVDENEIESYLRDYKISNVSKENDGIHLRVVSDRHLSDVGGVIPNLEDMYLALFGE